MSDRTPSSVRPGSRVGDGPASQEPPAGEKLPASSTQAIPTTGTQRAQSAGTGPGGGGVQATAGSPPVPPPTSPPRTGASPAVSGGPVTAPAGAPSGATSVAGASVPGTPARSSTATGAAPAGAPSGATSVAGASVPGTPPAVTARGRTSGKVAGRGPRRARLQLRHIDTWSALKISLVLSIALFFIWMVAVGVLYSVLSGLGVFGTLNDLFGQLGTASSGSEAGGDVITWRVVLGGAAVIGAINIVLLTALCTVATFIYNLCSDLVGGLEVTLSERD